MTRPEKAVRFFLDGCNCSQSVVLAFCDETGLDEKTALRLSSPFGGGTGRLREVCGTVSGASMVLGWLYGEGAERDRGIKAHLYMLVQSLAKEFAARNGSYICRELLSLGAGPDSYVPQERTAEYYRRRPCAECVRSAAEILEKLIARQDAQCGGEDG